MNVLVDKQKLDILANAISDKSGEPVTMTLAEMVEAVDGIDTSGITPTGNIDITEAGVTDVTNYETATVPTATADCGGSGAYSTESGVRKWKYTSTAYAEDAGWVNEGTFATKTSTYNAVPTGTAITPTESTQTVGGSNYHMEGAVTVNAIPSNYVGSSIARQTSLNGFEEDGSYWVEGLPGYYQNYVDIEVPSGTAGTPTATKGTVSNHSVSITPSVTNTSGYISGGTKTGTAVSVTASELVSGTYTVSASGTHNVTNYASASVASGTATASATKGTVSNHSVTVTPSVTRTAGYITAGSANGTAVTVSASELVSGSQAITENGTVDVTNLASVTVDVQGGSSSIHIGTATATPASTGTLAFTGMLSQPTSFYVVSINEVTSAQADRISSIVFDGTDSHIQTITNTANAQVTYVSGSALMMEYRDSTLILYASGRDFVETNTYRLVYTYGGNSSDIETENVQVGSGATSITFPVSGRPIYWSLIFKSNFSTSSGYQRAITVGYDGDDIYGLEMDSSAKYSSTHWTASYSGGNFTITSQGTNAGGYFHQPGYYQLTYAVDENAPSYQSKTVTPTTSQQVVTPDSGYDALSQVTVNAMPTGTAGTPTASKGSVSNHSVTVTPSVTNTTGYITGGTKTGTGVTVSASELVSGSETKTANGTYNVTNLASLVVSIPIVTYYTGSSNPSSSLGANGDIYLKTS